MKNKSQKKIPVEWERKKLSEIGRALIGLTYSPENVVETGGTLVFRSSNIKLGKIDYSDQVRVSANISEKNFVKEGDILICARNGSRNLIGKNAYISKDDEGNVFGAFMTVFRSKNPKYIYQLFQSSLYKKEIEMDLGPTINQVTTGNLSRFKFNFPPLPEQNRIVSVLETWDQAIEKLNKKIEIKKQVKKGLMQNLLTGKKRLKGFNDKWEISTIGNIGQVVTGNTPSKRIVDYYGNKYLWATALDFSGVYIEDTEIKLSESGKSVSRVVPPGSVLVTCIASIGKNAIAKKHMSFNQQINAIIPNKKYDPEFIYYLIENSFDKLKKVAGGGALAMISKGVFEKIKLTFPSLEEQKAISNILTTADKEITELKKKLSIIKDQKKHLLNNLITGTIRTPKNLKIN